MKADIIRWIKKMAPKHKLSAIYYPDSDAYCIDRKGRAVQNFNTKSFYEIPKLGRERMLNPLIKVGLNQNLGEKNRDQFIVDRKHGIRIV